MSVALKPSTNYSEAARRHLVDAEFLFASNRKANSGQLYGFVAECGMKALLIACKVPTDIDGGIAKKNPLNPKKGHPLRQHIPVLMDSIAAYGALIPDGALAAKYMAIIYNVVHLKNWSIDHRYWRESALPLASVTAWRTAAQDIGKMLDQAKEDGVL